eukprot:3440371-Lingulodinium_polyedra.AAC.1
MAPDICQDYPPDRDGAPLLVDTQVQGVELVDADVEEAATSGRPKQRVAVPAEGFLGRPPPEHLHREGLQGVERSNVPQALAGLKP